MYKLLRLPVAFIFTQILLSSLRAATVPSAAAIPTDASVREEIVSHMMGYPNLVLYANLPPSFTNRNAWEAEVRQELVNKSLAELITIRDNTAEILQLVTARGSHLRPRFARHVLMAPATFLRAKADDVRRAIATMRSFSSFGIDDVNELLSRDFVPFVNYNQSLEEVLKAHFKLMGPTAGRDSFLQSPQEVLATSHTFGTPIFNFLVPTYMSAAEFYAQTATWTPELGYIFNRTHRYEVEILINELKRNGFVPHAHANQFIRRRLANNLWGFLSGPLTPRTAARSRTLRAVAGAIVPPESISSLLTRWESQGWNLEALNTVNGANLAANLGLISHFLGDVWQGDETLNDMIAVSPSAERWLHRLSEIPHAKFSRVFRTIDREILNPAEFFGFLFENQFWHHVEVMAGVANQIGNTTPTTVVRQLLVDKFRDFAKAEREIVRRLPAELPNRFDEKFLKTVKRLAKLDFWSPSTRKLLDDIRKKYGKSSRIQNLPAMRMLAAVERHAVDLEKELGLGGMLCPAFIAEEALAEAIAASARQYP